MKPRVKRRGPPLVSATKRVRATKSRRRLASRAIDIDDAGRVVGLDVSMLASSRPASTSSSLLASSMAGVDDIGPTLERRGPGIYPDKGDIEAVARWIAAIALVPVEIVVDVIRKLESVPKFLLVGFVLYELTRREHVARTTTTRRR